MRARLRRWAPALAALGGALLVLAPRPFLPAPYERARLLAFDTLQRLSPRVPAVPSQVAVVAIDEASLARLGQWPWPRDTVAALVEALRGLGATAIGFDMVFAEPDRTAPGPDATTPGAHDAALAAALRGGRVVLGFGLLPGVGGRAPAIKAGFAAIGTDPAASVARFGGAVTDLPALEDAADGLGSFTVLPGRDQMVRRMPLLQALGDQLVPSLVLETLRVALGVDTIAVRARMAGDRPVGFTLRLGPVSVPVDADGAIWLHHAPTSPGALIPAWEVLDPATRAALRPAVAGKMVLVGATATGLVDLRPTPLNPFEPGVAINAGAIAQIVQQRFLERPIWAATAELAAALLLAAGIGGLASRASVRTTALAAAGALAAVPAAAFAAFQAGLLLDPMPALATLALAFVAASLARYLVAERDALRLRAAFAHYLAPALVERLARDPGQLRLGGEVREMTFLFTDLEGFTALTESQGAEALVELLNRYLDGLCRIAVANGGTLDKIVGDALHVMFNAPLEQPDHAARAVRCALEMDAFATGFAAEQAARGLAFGRTRIGVNSGRAVVGNFGGSRRFDYTAHGDAINTAARLEAANKQLGTRICVARSTVDLLGDEPIALRPAGTLLLRGKSVAIEVFEPLADWHAAAGWATTYADAYAKLRQGDAAGAEALLALHTTHPDDPLLALHARRIRSGDGAAPLGA